MSFISSTTAIINNDYRLWWFLYRGEMLVMCNEKECKRYWLFFVCFCSLVKHVQKGITQWWGEAPAQHISAAVLPFLYKTPNYCTALRKVRPSKETSVFFSDEDSLVKEISPFCNRTCSSKTGNLMLNHATTPYIWWQPSKMFTRQHKSSTPSQLFTFSSCHPQLFSLYS